MSQIKKVIPVLMLFIAVLGIFFLPVSTVMMHSAPLSTAMSDAIRVSTEKDETKDFSSTDIDVFTNREFVFYVPPAYMVEMNNFGYLDDAYYWNGNDDSNTNYASGGPRGNEYYYPIAKSLSPEHQGAIIVVKLNEHSQRVFNYELFAEQFEAMDGGAINAILSQLCVNARDASFPGYPYGLIDADDQARVRMEEAQRYRLLLLSEVSKIGAWPKFSRHIQSTDAHSVLNMLSGGEQ